MKRKITPFLAVALALCLQMSTVGSVWVFAAGARDTITGTESTNPTEPITPTPTPEIPTPTPEPEKPTYKECWIKKGSKYFWRTSDGSIRKKSGPFDVGKYRYYLDKDGSRVENCFKRIKGEYYYFLSNGKMLRTGKRIFQTIDKKRYGFYEDGRRVTGRVRMGDKKYYYFDARGVLQKNIRGIKDGKYYYNVNKDGTTVKISAKKAECEKAAQNFIKKHTKSTQTNAQKFRTCFNYLLGYMRYSPGYFPTSSDYNILSKTDGVYEMALSTFNSTNLRGNCHRFACCVGVIARELGYDKPAVITTTGDHSFVMINGLYYDNMYGIGFGATSRPSYKVYKKTVIS